MSIPCSPSPFALEAQEQAKMLVEELEKENGVSPERSAAILAELTGKLQRLAELENHFQTVLEREKFEAMAELAAGAGHEINNPLTVISGRAQLLLKEETDPERRHALALMNAQAMRVYEMIADMMLFARPPQMHAVSLDFVTLLEKILGEFLPLASKQETTVEFSRHFEPISIKADPVHLTVAINALLKNALEALTRGGKIAIRLEKNDHEAILTLHDDGPGIKPEERRHLFDPFYSARQAGRGLGMGLCKAMKIIQLHGGDITVESEPKRGATFTVTLPAD